MTQEDIDKEGIFKINKESILSTESNMYFEIAAIHKEKDEKYRGYELRGLSNPTCCLKEIFQELTGSGENYYESFLWVNLLKYIFLLPQYKQLTKDELFEEVYSYKFTVAEVPNLEQKPFNFIIENIELLKSSKITEDELDSAIEKTFWKEKEEVLGEHDKRYDKQYEEEYIKNMLIDNIIWNTTTIKLKILEEYKEKLNQLNIYVLNLKKSNTQKKYYKHEILIFVPQVQVNGYNDKMLHKIMQELTKENQSPIEKMGEAFYNTLINFYNQTRFHYPCISPNNVSVIIKKESYSINLMLFPVIQSLLGISLSYKSLPSLFHSKFYSFHNFPFWQSKSRMENKKSFFEVSDCEILWEFIFLMDYIEKGDKSYLKSAETFEDLKIRQKSINEIILKNLTDIFFGEHTSNILKYLKAKSNNNLKLEKLTIFELDRFYHQNY